MAAIFQYKTTVGPSSIDVLRHVNNREYLRWMEKAAMDHADSLGCGARDCLRRQEVWVAREHWIEFLMPCYLNDELTVYTWVDNIGNSRSLRRYAIKRGDDLVSVGATEWVYIDFKTGRPKVLPDEIHNRFEVVSLTDPRLVELGLTRGVPFQPHYVHD